ncbi:MAG: hypothetical protein ACRDQB_16510 [Thermocrispum sp.]
MSYPPGEMALRGGEMALRGARRPCDPEWLSALTAAGAQFTGGAQLSAR